MHPDLVVGKLLPDLELEDHRRQTVKLSTLADGFPLMPGLTIHRIYDGWWYVGRPTLEELRQDTRAMMQQCRSDFTYAEPARGDGA